MDPDTNPAPRHDKHIRWALIISILFIVGLAIDHYFFHIISLERLKQQEIENTAPAPSTPPSPTTEPSPSPAAQITPLHQFQETVKACLGDELSTSNTPDRLMQNYLVKNPVENSDFQLENTHVRLPDGSTRRLHLIQADSSNSKQARELRYFQLDAEGLPVRIPLKPDETLNPKPEFVDSLKKQGSIIFHQIKEKKTLKDGTRVSLNTVNDHIFEFQIFGRDKTLSCRELDCLCQ